MTSTRAERTPEQSFDESLQQLEQLAAQLESADIPLEDALQVYERAVGLFRQCRERLGSVEQRLEKLTRDLDGEALVESLDVDVDGEIDG